MCKFISLVLDKTVRTESFLDAAKQVGFDFRNYENDSIASQLGNVNLFIAKGPHCDCDTPIGMDRQEDERDWMEIKKKELKKKGWSETKIERAVTQMQTQKLHQTDHTQQLHRWLDLLKNTAKLDKVNGIGLLIHFYNGDVSQERFAVKVAQKCNLSDIVGSYLQFLEHDTLHQFK